MTDHNNDKKATTRRNALALLGIGAVGGAAATAGYSELTANRPIDVSVEGEDDAVIRVDPDDESELTITNQSEETIDVDVISDEDVVLSNEDDLDEATQDGNTVLITDLSDGDSVTLEFSSFADQATFDIDAFSDSSGFSVQLSRTVSIDSDITDRFLMDEGTGTTFNNDVGSVDASFTSGDWSTVDGAFGDTVPEYDRNDEDIWSTDDVVSITTEQVSVAGWFKITETDRNSVAMGGLDENDELIEDDAWWIAFETDDDVYRISGQATTLSDVSITFDEWVMLGVVWDGDDWELLSYDVDGFVESDSGSEERTVGTDARLGGMARLNRDRCSSGQTDVTAVAADEVWDQSDFDDFHKLTVGDRE